jgi:hypothetical protein
VIKFLPEASETLVVAHDWNVVIDRLNVARMQVDVLGGPTAILAGWILNDRFQLMVSQRRPNSFMPVVDGKIDPTSNGCLIFLRYRLIPSTRIFLVAWTFIALVSGVILSVHHNSILFGLGSILVMAIIHGIAWGNFLIHRKTLHDIILTVLT